jgi:chemotaxis protein MotA
MFAIIGILIVILAVAGGYLMEKGHLLVLMQPAELLIIGGAAIGTMLIANPVRILKAIVAGIDAIFGKPQFEKERYLAALRMMYELFNKARRGGGMLTIEIDIENPSESPIFQAYPQFLKDKHACDFVCDTMRIVVAGNAEPFDMDQMMDLDMEVRHHAAMEPVTALSTMADSLPGLGIVAAVLGVVITMGALGGPPDAIGHKVAAALVGTFLGILLCYGFLGPVAAHIKKHTDAEGEYFLCLRMGMLANMKGLSPMLALEAARRAIPHHLRPTFQEMDKVCRKTPETPVAEAAA